ncbi:acyltransferase family protein [Roseomonas sp. BN140053]|uniref:acyltransferase family protein n=1 Tax=Roseomonas sp. BN140053 TaxID=3391898 RepID=UPI0039E9AB96
MQPRSESGGPDRNQGLDLLRAVAILLVLASHFGLYAASVQTGSVPLVSLLSGFFGVELFFVLSGFLIGNLLLRIAGRGPNLRDWGIFLLRRVMRTAPAYLTWLAVLAVVMPPAANLPGHLLAFATVTQNLAWPMPADNWFAVSWSLTVEEWFYLLFGTAFLAGAALLPRRGPWIVLAAFLLLPLLARAAVPADLPWDTAVRKVAALRLDAIAYGVLLAWLLRGRAVSRRVAALAGGLGLGLLLALCAGWLRQDAFDLKDEVWRSVVFNLTSLGFALFFPAALRWSTAQGALRHVILWLSTRSYGLYLVHFSLLELVAPLLTPGFPLVVWLLEILLVTFLLAELSWRFIEAPVLARRPRQPGSTAPASVGASPGHDAIRLAPEG